VETNTITVDPEKLLQLAPGETAAPAEGEDESIEFSINPERVGPVLRRLVTPTRTRARIYDQDGLLLLDSLALSSRGVIRAPMRATPMLKTQRGSSAPGRRSSNGSPPPRSGPLTSHGSPTA